MVVDKQFQRLVILAILLSIAMPALAADEGHTKEQPRFAVVLGMEYSSGRYGADVTTDAVAIPMKLNWNPTDRLELSLGIPYLYQSNSETTSFGMGRFRISRNQQSGLRSSSSRFASSFDTASSQSGIGDLVLNGGYKVLKEGRFIPEIRPEAYVKFPTADKSKGLGSGEFDGGIGLVLTKRVKDWNGYFEGIYNFIGKYEDFQLKNYFSYETGLGYQVDDRFQPAIAIKGATNPGDDSEPPFELRVKAQYSVTGRIDANVYLSKGFTDGAADYGAGAEISCRF